MAAILSPKRPGETIHTSTVIERSTGGKVVSAPGLSLSAVAGFGGVDAEGLAEAPSPQRGNDHGVAALHPLHPAEIEVASGGSGAQRTRDVRASLGPIKAESARVAAVRTRRGKL